MKTTVQLESKDVRKMIAKFLEITEEQVIPNRYSFSIDGLTVEEIEKKIGTE